MKFQIVYNEALARWHAEGPEGQALTEPMRSGQLLMWLVNEVKVPAQASDPGWSRPIAHKTKRADGSTADTPLYEIKAGKVQRIASSAKERTEQQTAELLALLGDLS